MDLGFKSLRFPDIFLSLLLGPEEWVCGMNYPLWFSWREGLGIKYMLFILYAQQPVYIVSNNAGQGRLLED